MRVGRMIDAVAQRVLELRKVSSTQWLLRLLGAAMTVLALLLAVGVTGLFEGFPAQVITVLVLVTLLLPCRNPDTDLGLLAPAGVLIAVLLQDDVTMLRAAGVGLALLLAHSAFALAGSLPVHGEFGRGAWHLAVAGLLAVLGVSVVAGALVILLSTVQLGSWMMIVGVLAAIGLFIAALPRAE